MCACVCAQVRPEPQHRAWCEGEDKKGGEVSSVAREVWGLFNLWRNYFALFVQVRLCVEPVVR